MFQVFYFSYTHQVFFVPLFSLVFILLVVILKMLRVKVKGQWARGPVGNEMEVVRTGNALDEFDLEDVPTM